MDRGQRDATDGMEDGKLSVRARHSCPFPQRPLGVSQMRHDAAGVQGVDAAGGYRQAVNVGKHELGGICATKHARCLNHLRGAIKRDHAATSAHGSTQVRRCRGRAAAQFEHRHTRLQPAVLYGAGDLRRVHGGVLLPARRTRRKEGANTG